MTIKKIIAIFLVMGFSLSTLAAGLNECDYETKKILRLNADESTGSKARKLCIGEIVCSKAIAGKESDVMRTIVCKADAKGQCPSVEVCRADVKIGFFEK